MIDKSILLKEKLEKIRLENEKKQEEKLKESLKNEIKYHSNINLEHLKLINALISLSKYGSETCPPLLLNIGYSLIGVDKKEVFSNTEIKSDVLTSNGSNKLFFEAKSGKNISLEQFNNYKSCYIKDSNFNIGYAVFKKDCDFINEQINNNSGNFPVIGFDSNNIKVLGDFRDVNIKKSLDGQSFNINSVYSYVKYDHQSSYFTIASEISRYLLAISFRRESISLDALIEKTNKVIWDHSSEEEKSLIRNRVKKVIDEIKKSSLGKYLEMVFTDNQISFNRKNINFRDSSLETHRLSLMGFLEEKK